MISVGIDISKEKITVCALEQGSKIIWKPFDVSLNKTKVEELLEKLEKIKEKVKITIASSKSGGYFSTINSVRKEVIPILHYFCIMKK